MSSFCGKCGRPLKDGEVCTCSQQSNLYSPPSESASQNKLKTINSNKTNFSIKSSGSESTFIEGLKNRMGIGDPDLNKGDAYEKGKQIVPDIVEANEGEVPVRQYTIAHLRNRFLGITYSQAIGRLQITNKRILFRAPGKSLGGRTILQHEFLVDEVAGIETRREYIFNFFDMLIAILISGIGLLIGGAVSSFFMNVAGSDVSAVIFVIMGWLLGFACLLPFFLINKKWLLKICFTAASITINIPLAMAIGYRHEFLSYLTFFISFVFFIFYITNALIASIKPNLVLIVKTKGASDAIDIKCKRRSMFNISNSEKEDHTGYTEIIPINNVEGAVREIGAVINDIQKLGDYGIEKWKI